MQLVERGYRPAQITGLAQMAARKTPTALHLHFELQPRVIYFGTCASYYVGYCSAGTSSVGGAKRRFRKWGDFFVRLWFIGKSRLTDAEPKSRQGETGRAECISVRPHESRLFWRGIYIVWISSRERELNLLRFLLFSVKSSIGFWKKRNASVRITAKFANRNSAWS